MAISTTAETIAMAQISIYLAGNYVSDGALYGARKAPCSPVTINIINDALSWGYYGGSQTDKDIRQMSNYLIWLIGMFGQQAGNIITGGGGGSITPINPPVSNQYPILIKGSNFETDGITYINSNIIDDSIMIFIAQFNQEWHFIPEFHKTSNGIIIDGIADFNANDYPYIIIEKYST